LFLRGLERALNLAPGFEYQQLITIDPGLDTHGFQPPAALAYWTQMEARIRQAPGVEAAALVNLPPLGQRRWISRLPSGMTVVNYVIEPDYFRALSIPLRRGRNFAPGEKDAVIVSESFAQSVWPGEEALGKSYQQKTVIGIAGSARTVMLSDPTTVEMYSPMDAETLTRSVLVVRVLGKPEDAAGLLRPIARTVDPQVVPEIGLVRDSFEARLADPRRAAILLTVLGLTALAFAAVGLAGLVSFTVAQRAREIGIRLALGARPAHILTAVFRQFRWPVLAGLAAGMAGAAIVGLALRKEMYGVSNLDPLSYAAAAALFLVITALAALGPARRALRVDPIATLRSE
jgi:hypothetical protein